MNGWSAFGLMRGAPMQASCRLPPKSQNPPPPPPHTPGQVVDVKVIKVDRSRRNVSLSLRAMQKDPLLETIESQEWRSTSEVGLFTFSMWLAVRGLRVGRSRGCFVGWWWWWWLERAAETRAEGVWLVVIAVLGGLLGGHG